MKGILLVFVASIVALATGQDCPAYYVRSRNGESCYRYFDIPLPYGWANEFCEMVTPCGNAEAVMGSLATVSSPLENREIYDLVASFSQDNVMEKEVWLGWNSKSPYFWEDGTPAYPHGYNAFTNRAWPVNPANPSAPPPGVAPVMERDNLVRMRIGNRFIGIPVWRETEVTGHDHSFVCEVPVGKTILPPNQPNNPNQPNQPLPPNQPGGPPNANPPNQPNNPRQNQPNQPRQPGNPGQPRLFQ